MRLRLLLDLMCRIGHGTPIDSTTTTSTTAHLRHT